MSIKNARLRATYRQYTMGPSGKKKKVYATVASIPARVLSWIFPHATSAPDFSISAHDLIRECAPAGPFPLPECFAAFSYKDTRIRALVRHLKYKRSHKAGALLGEALALSFMEELAERRQYSSFEDPLIIPIPLHPNRQKERGYNQSHLIAEAFSKTLGLASPAPLLVRMVDTGSLAQGAGRTERYARMKGAFRVQHPADVRGRDIIVIDDIITTGATLAEAKKTLIQAGAREILLLAVAH